MGGIGWYVVPHQCDGAQNEAAIGAAREGEMMGMWRREYLVEVAEKAQESVRTLFGLFDVEAPAVRLTPGVVQMVLEAHAELGRQATVKNGQSDGPVVLLTWNPPEEASAPDEEAPTAESVAPANADAVEDDQAAEVDERDPVTVALERIQALAVDGELPSMAVYNKEKPADAATVYELLRSLGGIRWTDLAERLGLRLSKRAEEMLAMRERAAAVVEPSAPEEEAADEEEQPHVSAAVAAVLGPEHVVVTPHGSERVNGHAPAQRPPEAMVQRPPEAITGNYAQTLRGPVVAALQKMAVDGVMPTQKEWNAQKPIHLPSAEGVVWRLEMAWDALAEAAGLAVGTGWSLPTLSQARTNAAARKEMLEEVIFRLRDMAADGVLPSTSAWNERRGELPTAADLTMLFALDNWNDMASTARLALPGKRRGKQAESFRA